MRIYPSPVVMDEQKPPLQPASQTAPACRSGNVSACAKFPRERALLPHHGLADAITSHQIFTVANAARLLRSDGNAMGTAKKEASIISLGTYPVDIFLLLQRVYRPHGQSFRIRQSSASVRAALSSPASCIAC